MTEKLTEAAIIIALMVVAYILVIITKVRGYMHDQTNRTGCSFPIPKIRTDN